MSDGNVAIQPLNVDQLVRDSTEIFMPQGLLQKPREDTFNEDDVTLQLPIELKV